MYYTQLNTTGDDSETSGKHEGIIVATPSGSDDDNEAGEAVHSASGQLSRARQVLIVAVLTFAMFVVVSIQ
jgi:hypothetical protein